jgi:hypothetical protein
MSDRRPVHELSNTEIVEEAKRHARPERVVSPQEGRRCACPRWSSARTCIHLRHAPDDSEPYEECECACHEPDEDDDSFG